MKLLLLHLYTFLVCSLLPSSLFADDEVVIVSPNGQVELKLEVLSGQPYYSVFVDGEEWVGYSELGLEMAGSEISFKDVSMASVNIYSIDSLWSPVYGEASVYREHFQGGNIQYKANQSTQKGYNLEVKVFDTGIAFRYHIASEQSVTVLSELTTFNLPSNAQTWVTHTAQGKIEKMSVSNIEEEAVERPLLVELSDHQYIAIGEAGLYDFARMKLKGNKTGPGLQASLASKIEYPGSFKSPWRFIMLGHSPNTLLQNNELVLHLSPPNAIGKTDWIEPGKVIREVTLTTQGGMACVDFAVKHGIRYVEFDAGWYGNEYDDASDATTVTVDPKRSKGPLELQKVIDYAESKNIGIILYLNRRSLERQLEEVLPLLHSWGIKGVKYGFVRVGDQEWTKWLHDAVALAAKYKLMVDIHDEYRPTGMSRTYPNLLTQEGIRGDEESPDNTMVLKTIYTRMLAGAGDHTVCYFADRVETMGSHGSQLAKTVCLYSPWQFVYWYDRPEASPRKVGGAGKNEMFIAEIPELGFFDAVPTVWDETKILGGYPGLYNVTARRNGKNWYLGVINGEEERKLDLSLTFLDDNATYDAIIYTDDPSLNPPHRLRIDQEVVDSRSQLSLEINSNNGAAILFRKR
ncbi:glycoside hydrolase family 97 protein [Membranihabitans marinus]|uniref:glycoside hydrolase family 97 protein n=1 Tax=Membranihabitans marinus TaxID=1227546 RepID=UPI001F46EA8A|nr:glycoside hydrolase family 97 protein [Membranihabitans marinus]